MSVFTYTVNREPAPGSVLLSSATREFRLLSARPIRRPINKQNVSLAGNVESLLFRSEKHFSCQSELIEPEGLVDAHMIEFLASVENGETFTFDRLGTVAQPDNPVTCVMVSKTYPVAEKGKKFNAYGFVIRES